MSDPRKHHFVPQFYQRGFIADGSDRIWVYKKGKEPRRYYTKKTGMKIDLYAFNNSRGNIDAGTVERQLSLLDDHAAKIIRRLEKGKTLADKERVRLSQFVSVMWRRTPKAQERVNKIGTELVPKVFDDFIKAREPLSDEEKAEIERLRQLYTRKTPDFLFAKNVIRNSMFEVVMFSMDWGFFRPPPGREFLTCDDPTRFNTGSGLKDQKATIIFPLSRQLLLQCMRISSYQDGFSWLTDEQLDYLNLWTVKGAHNQVYASYQSEEIRTLVDENIGAV